MSKCLYYSLSWKSSVLPDVSPGIEDVMFIPQPQLMLVSRRGAGVREIGVSVKRDGGGVGSFVSPINGVSLGVVHGLKLI